MANKSINYIYINFYQDSNDNDNSNEGKYNSQVLKSLLDETNCIMYMP